MTDNQEPTPAGGQPQMVAWTVQVMPNVLPGPDGSIWAGVTMRSGMLGNTFGCPPADVEQAIKLFSDALRKSGRDARLAASGIVLPDGVDLGKLPPPDGGRG